MNDKNLSAKTPVELPANSNDDPPKNDSSLEALVRQEQSVARERLRDELEREPTQAETDEWLNEQTEGY